MLTDGIKKQRKKKVKVMDIAELIANAQDFRALDIKSKIRNFKIKKKMYVPFEDLPEESKFGSINRIENFLMPNFLKLKLICRHF
jgi:hypothetical protein